MTRSPQSDTERLPIDPHTGEPIPPRAQPGYYPGFSTLSQAEFWDEATRVLVMKRVNDIPPIRFFDAEELPIARAVFDRIIPQDDRDEAHRIAVVNYVDARLHEGQTSGYRYEDMPPDREAYRDGLRGIDEIAKTLFKDQFAVLPPDRQDAVLETLVEARPPVPRETWKRVSVKHFWRMLVTDAADAYYAHPWAWDEIGFGGPAYPRGYMRLTNGLPEPWEVDERRYDWRAPPTSRSDVYRPLERVTQSGESGHGEGGSH